MSASEYKPDCGYAWMVVASCFTINFIMAGLARAAGVLYTSLIDVYGVTREVATTPFSLRFCLRNLSGPVVGALGQRFGIRPVVVLGGLICGVGGILSALAPNVTWIIVAWGGIHGVGYGMCNLIHLIVINRYFDKYKGLAIGISVAGDCFGTFVLPSVLECLLAMYGVRGTFLILAGISLNVVPAAMLLKSPSWENNSYLHISPQQTESAKLNNIHSKKGIGNEGFDSTSGDSQNDVQLKSEKNSVNKTSVDCQQSNSEFVFNNQGTYFVNENSIDEKYSKTRLVEPRNTGKHTMEYIDEDKLRHITRNDLMDNTHNLMEFTSLKMFNKKFKMKRFDWGIGEFLTKNKRTYILPVSCSANLVKNTSGSKHGSSSHAEDFYPCNACNRSTKTPSDLNYEEPFICIHQDKVLNTKRESLSNINSSIHRTEQNTTSNQHMCITSLSDQKCPAQPDYHEENHSKENIETDNTVSSKSTLVNFVKTNTKPILLVLSATLALYFFLFITVFTIINDYASDNNIPGEYGKYLIIAFSVTDVFGRIGLGFVLDKNWIEPRHFALLTTGLTGFFILIVPFYKCFAFWIVSFTLCGFVQGGTAMMFPVLVDYYMEKNEQTIALGSLYFYAGILILPVPPMIGYFRDNIGSYDGVFWTVGALCMLAAALWIFEPCLVNKKGDKRDRESFNSR